jgi:hypothetical protein
MPALCDQRTPGAASARGFARESAHLARELVVKRGQTPL